MAALRAPGRARFGPIRRVTGLQINNEVNIAFSPNTSDGAYRRSVEALVRGVVAAKRESLRLGYRHQQIGFNFAWRFLEEADKRFWETIGRLRRPAPAPPHRLGRTRYLPGTFAPGLFFPAPIVDFGDAFLEGVAQTRECYMPIAGFGPRVPLRIEETGYATGPGRSEADTGDRDRGLRTGSPSLSRHLQHHGLPLLRAARQQQRRPELPAALRPAARRLQPRSPPSTSSARDRAPWRGLEQALHPVEERFTHHELQHDASGADRDADRRRGRNPRGVPRARRGRPQAPAACPAR